MKRVGEKGAGRGYFVPISWEEALDTIAEKMTRGAWRSTAPTASSTRSTPSFEKNGFPLGALVGGRLRRMGRALHVGPCGGRDAALGRGPLQDRRKGLSEALPGFEASDIFNSKLFVMWGMDPVVAWFGPTSYYMQLAHEYGCKTIVIDPRYTQSAELLADQWIPIRPGTDLAMMLAVAQVLYEEDLIDHEFVDQWVDKAGFEEWRAYCMGEGEDGIKKTPEWAAPICAVPAETIREFARLYGTTKPVHLQYFYSLREAPHGRLQRLGLHAPAGHDRQHRLRRRLPDGRLPAHARPRARPARRLRARPGRLPGAGALQQQLPDRDTRPARRTTGRAA